MARITKSARELRIVLDTNALFTQVASDLVNSETAAMIKENGGHPDLKVSWFLPETVIEERSYQMRDRAASLIPSIEKLERLLGHNLAISRETLDHQVQLAISRNLTQLGIKSASLDTGLVDWKKLIESAHRREPPFEAGEKEKGFRDALILETFVQLVAQSPRTRALCRVVLVTADGMLATATQARIADYSNAQVLVGLDELKNLINTLSSQVDESFVNELKIKAAQLFFISSDNKDTLYYKEKIYDRITNEYDIELKTLPEGAESRESDGITISHPQFIKKEGQRISWNTRIRFKAKTFRLESSISDTPGLDSLPVSTDSPAKVGIGLLANALRLYGSKEKKLFKTGATIFDVKWSVTVDAKRKLLRPDIEQIAFSETVWD
ncbi:MAG: PIN domain-containing protein [Thiobacillus sp.]|nr:PIN domain-containing protein [Thiobacillus sp.]MDP3124510.1 PIN domain-containing protein [Thiobacillus sp.]